MKKSSKKLSILIGELPQRAVKIDKSQIEKIFGGYQCRENMESCNNTCDCCNGLVCNTANYIPGLCASGYLL